MTIEDQETREIENAEVAAQLIAVRPPIKLAQLLKLANIVDEGNEAKELIQAGCVSVNGEICTARGRQLQEGDHVSVAAIAETEDGEEIEIQADLKVTTR